MAFKPHCPKCLSTNIYAERDPRVSWENDMILRCYPCGWALYGKEKAEKLLDEQRSAFLLSEEQKKVEAAAAVSEKIVVADFSDWEVNHSRIQKSRISKGLCANISCNKGDSGPADARSNSIYCSRKCCVDNAHRRERERKRIQKSNAALAA